MPQTRADSISATALSLAVDQAVELAVARHGLTVGEKNVIGNWDLIGRRLDDTQHAEAFANDVASHVSDALGHEFEPGLVKIGKHTLAGFVERGRVPIIRDIL